MSIITTTAQNVGTPGHDLFPMSNNTPTPRTDGIIRFLKREEETTQVAALIDEAHKLERDLAAAKAEVAALKDKSTSGTYAIHMIEAANRRRAEEQEKNSTLQDLLFAQTQECRVFRADLARERARWEWLEKHGGLTVSGLQWSWFAEDGKTLAAAVADAMAKEAK